MFKINNAPFECMREILHLLNVHWQVGVHYTDQEGNIANKTSKHLFPRSGDYPREFGAFDCK